MAAIWRRFAGVMAVFWQRFDGKNELCECIGCNVSKYLLGLTKNPRVCRVMLEKTRRLLDDFKLNSTRSYSEVINATSTRSKIL